MNYYYNFRWHFPFLGFLTAFITFSIGAMLTVIELTAPLGLGLIQYSRFLLRPYTMEMVPQAEEDRIISHELWKTHGKWLYILYLIFIATPILALSLVQVVAMFCTIIGIPSSLKLVKKLKHLFYPFFKVARLQPKYQEREDRVKEKARHRKEETSHKVEALKNARLEAKAEKAAEASKATTAEVAKEATAEATAEATVEATINTQTEAHASTGAAKIEAKATSEDKAETSSTSKIKSKEAGVDDADEIPEEINKMDGFINRCIHNTDSFFDNFLSNYTHQHSLAALARQKAKLKAEAEKANVEKADQ